MRQRKLKPAWREKAFEDSAADFGAEFAIRSCKTTYADAQIHAMWCMWREGRQAARRAALEDAAQVCKQLGYSLDGVIIDTEEGNGFDAVCLNTVKRVRRELGEMARALAAQTGQEGK